MCSSSYTGKIGIPKRKIPFLRPPFGPEERYEVYQIMTSADISTGKYIQEFEDAFRDYIGAETAISCCNGSVALDLVWQTYLRTGRLRKGDKVLLPSFTFVAVANSVVNAGLVPVFCDIDRNTWNIDIYAAQERKIRAIIAVHTFGNPCDMDDMFGTFAQDCIIVEDCCEACGAEWKGKKVGSFGDAAIFSFNATKNMTCGEGGAVVFNSDDYGEVGMCNLLKENGFGYHTRDAILPGYNYRLDNIHCAIALQQLKTLDHRNHQRRLNANALMNGLEDVVGEDAFQQVNYDHVYQIFGMLVNDRDNVYDYLTLQGIECKKYFDPPCHEQQYYHKNYIHPDFPNTDYISKHILCLPMYPQLTDADIGYMIERISEVV